MGIDADSQLLEPGNLVTLFELDCSSIGGDVLLFHGYVNDGTITWQGKEYKPWPIEAEGFVISGEEQQAAPTLRVGNVDGTIGALCIYLNDLIGARITRRRTLSKYLDAVNFPEGNPTADPEERYPDDVYYVEQKTSHNKEVVEFEMKSALDLSDVFLPRRLIVAGTCGWRYRSADCSYTGTAYFNANDEPVDAASDDICGKRPSSCRLRFVNQDLPFGGFPAASLVRT